jgi:hypothetical protein
VTLEEAKEKAQRLANTDQYDIKSYWVIKDANGRELHSLYADKGKTKDTPLASPNGAGGLS